MKNFQFEDNNFGTSKHRMNILSVDVLGASESSI